MGLTQSNIIYIYSHEKQIPLVSVYVTLYTP